MPSMPMREEKSEAGSLRQTAYARFKDALFAARIRPGEFLSQREISLLVRVPLGPVREALKALEAEGIVTLMPKRGIKVIQIDRKALAQAFEAREVIEGEAARRFAETGPEDVIRNLKAETDAFVARFTSLTDRDETLFEERVRLDFLLHDTVMTVLDNPILQSAFDAATEHVRIFRLNIAANQNVFDFPAMREHQEIIAQLEARDGEKARACMIEHLRGALKRSMA